VAFVVSVTPGILARHLPRGLWAKLLAACLAAPRTDARLLIDTIGVPVICEEVPGKLLWIVPPEDVTATTVSAAPAPPAGWDGDGDLDDEPTHRRVSRPRTAPGLRRPHGPMSLRSPRHRTATNSDFDDDTAVGGEDRYDTSISGVGFDPR
jgi:hypothetical protein